MRANGRQHQEMGDAAERSDVFPKALVHFQLVNYLYILKTLACSDGNMQQLSTDRLLSEHTSDSNSRYRGMQRLAYLHVPGGIY